LAQAMIYSRGFLTGSENKEDFGTALSMGTILIHGNCTVLMTSNDGKRGITCADPGDQLRLFQQQVSMIKMLFISS
jgi:hypothetical protein